MSKYGWKKGQGLGAAEDGVTKALRVKETPVDKPAGGSSSSSQTNAEGSSGGPVGRRGVIVSERRDAKDKSEKERFGEPSRFVCLTNMVARSEVDDELPSEIGAVLCSALHPSIQLHSTDVVVVRQPTRLKSTASCSDVLCTSCRSRRRWRKKCASSSFSQAWWALGKRSKSSTVGSSTDDMSAPGSSTSVSHVQTGKAHFGRPSSRFFPEVWAERAIWGMSLD